MRKPTTILFLILLSTVLAEEATDPSAAESVVVVDDATPETPSEETAETAVAEEGAEAPAVTEETVPETEEAAPETEINDDAQNKQIDSVIEKFKSTNIGEDADAGKIVLDEAKVETLVNDLWPSVFDFAKECTDNTNIFSSVSISDITEIEAAEIRSIQLLSDLFFQYIFKILKRF